MGAISSPRRPLAPSPGRQSEALKAKMSHQTFPSERDEIEEGHFRAHASFHCGHGCWFDNESVSSVWVLGACYIDAV